MTTDEREELQDNLIHQVIQDLDFKTMYALIADMLQENYNDYTAEELVNEVKEYYPELLDDQESERS